jgi:hypothetical protein
MSIETNLNQSPYFDDFAENKNFHRVLFRPGFAVQARELTQLQSILQNQIERFADEILVDGTIVTGSPIKTETINFVKLRDKDANNRVVLLSDFFSGGSVANATVTGATSGMTAQLVDAKEGSEAADPNFFSIFVQYTNSGANNTTKAFSDNETLVVRNRNGGAFIVAANTIASSSTGTGYRATVGDGILYHKGNFIRISPQSIIVNKFNARPSAQIGFESAETIIDSNQDSSLLDNATGATNFAAPGANRLKITPTLVARPINSANTTTFVTVAEIIDGTVTKKNTDTIYSDLGKYIAERTYDTNGNYAVSPFNVRIREHLKSGTNLGRYSDGNYLKLVAEIEKGAGYVNGNKVELINPIYKDVDKATDFETKDGRVISQGFGNYIIAKEVVGTWDFQGLRQVSLRDGAQKGISGKNLGAQGAQGAEIGTARVRGFQHHSGTPGTFNGQFRIYLFDISMNAGKSFSDVRGIYENNSSGPKSMADIVLTNGQAKLQEPGLNTLVFPFTQRGTKQLTDSTGTVDTQFVFRTEKTVTFTGGTATVTANSAHAGGTETLNETGTLTNTEERNVLVVAKSAAETAAHTGSISGTSGNTVTGSGTVFTTAYQVGDFIKIGSNPIQRITQIVGDTSLKVANTYGGSETGAHKTIFPTGYIFDLSGNGTISSTSTAHTINLQQANLSSFSASVYFNVLRTSAVQTTKTVNKNRFVHINTGSNPASASGPWPLGVSDAFKLVAVYKGSNTGVTTTDNDVTSHFELDTGMKDAMYDTAFLKKKSTSTLNTTNAGLMVKFHHYGRDRSQGIGFLSVDSYPVDDNNTANTSAITTQDIPKFVSPTTGKSYDLRDAVDFRPLKANTVAVSTTGTVALAPTNPTAATSFDIDADGAYFPTPDENFQADVQFYLPRKDRVVVTDSGRVEVIKGVPSLTPKTPDEKAGTMTISVLDIPVYPSLSAQVARETGRTDYQVKMTLENNRRYTMRDLRAIEDRVKNLEYYTSLNALETSARNKQLFGDTGLERFKNGFLVENFDGHNLSDTTKVGYRASIDRNNNILRPAFSRMDVPLAKDKSLSSTNVTKTGNILTLSYTHTNEISQPFASKLRNPVQEITFNWKGEVILDPPMDNTPDITTLPDIQLDFDGMYEAIELIANQTGITGIDWGNWTTVSSSSTQSGNAVTTQTQQIINGIQTSISPSTQSFDIGGFVENVAVRDFMRSRLIKFTGVGMKPNTRVFAYFDDELVSSFCTPANSSFANTAAEGSILTTDSTGTVYGNFRLPNTDALKFRIGTKRFELKDVANTITQSSLITTSAFGDYTSIPLDITQRGASVNLTTPQIQTDEVTDTRTLTSTVVIDPPRDDDRGRGAVGGDPMSQTFTVDTGDNSEGIMVTKVGVFFGRKSSTFPISLQIREVENGFPTPIILPYGSKTLQASAISANSSGTGGGSDETQFVFDAPVFLKAGKDYSITLKPAGDNDEYAVWVGELGGTDVDTSRIISKQPASGVLFSSANDKSWTAIQAEDLKFNLYRAEFTRSTGTIYVENEDVDFLNIDNLTGTFNAEEKVTGESILVVANTQTLSVGTVIRNKTNVANGTIRSIGTYGGGQVAIKIDNKGTFPTTGDAENLYVGASTFVGNVVSFTANTTSGFVNFLDTTNLKMNVKDSSGTFANGYIRGTVSGAVARVTAANNVVMNAVVPKIPQLTYANTSAAWSARLTSTGGTISTGFVDIDLGVENEFRDAEKKVFGKTNEAGLAAVAGSKKSLVIKGTLSTTDTKLSPVVDLSRANAYVIENFINNSFTNENNEVGDAEMRYISKPIELADGQDAEDIKVYLSSYKPSGTEINVYAKIHNAEDGQSFEDKDYSLLTQITASNTISDSVDTTDYREFEYGFTANTNGDNFLGSNSDNQAKLNSANNNVVSYRDSDGAIYATYKTFAIKIVMTSTGTNIIPLVKDMRAIALQR